MQQARFAYGKGALAAFTAVVLAVSLMVPATAFADPTSAEKRAEAEAVLASLNTMQEQLDRASNNYFTALSEQEEAEKSRDAAQERIDEANGQIADLQDRSAAALAACTARAAPRCSTCCWAPRASRPSLPTGIFSRRSTLRTPTSSSRPKICAPRSRSRKRPVFAEQARVAQEKADEAKRIEEEAASTVASMQATYDSLSAEAAELLEQERAAEEAARAAAAAAADAATNDSSRGSSNGGANSNGDGNNGASEPPSCSQRAMRSSTARTANSASPMRGVLPGRTPTTPGSRELRTHRQLFPCVHHRLAHGASSGEQSPAGRHLHERSPLRRLHRRRSDDPRSPDGRCCESQRGPQRHDLRAALASPLF